MAVQFYSGISSTALSGTNELPSSSWNVDPTVDIVRFRNSKTNAFSQKEATFKDVRGSIEIDFDFNDNPFAALNLNIGEKLTDVKLYLHGSSGTNALYWDFPSAIITGTPQRADTEGKITTTINFENDGDFGTPGNPVTP